MLSKIITHRNAYILGLMGVVFNLSVSEYALSVSQFFLAANWLIQGNRIERAKAMFKSKAAWLLSSLFGMRLIWLINTSNFHNALDDLRIKLPLFLLPFLFAGYSPLTKTERRVVVSFFALGLIVSSGFTFYNFLDLSQLGYADIRLSSIFISHIRLSLMLVLAAFLLPYEFWEGGAFKRLITLFLSAWFIFVVFLLKNISGVLVFIVSCGVLTWFLLKWLEKKSRLTVLGISVISLLALVFLVVYPGVKSFIHTDKVDESKLPYHTPNGNIYYHNLENGMVENGHVVWAYVCWAELREQWNAKSEIPFDSLGRSGQPIQTTLIRFLASKADPKDSIGVSRLSAKEIKAIQDGETNYYFMDDNSIRRRVYETAWEFHSYLVGAGNPSGNSAAQRFEFWKAAFHVIKNNSLIGVGTGDMVDEMQLAYNDIDTKLELPYRLKPHNQYLTTWVTFGIIGLIWFIAVWLIPFYTLEEKFPYVLFAGIAMASMLVEDTIEGQIGLTFVAFFYFLFTVGIAAQEPKKAIE